MGKIIGILGPHGVGKTSLQKEALKDGQFTIREGFVLDFDIEDCSSWEKFWAFQLKYWEKDKKQHEMIWRENKDCITSRTLEELYYYMLSHPIANGHEEEINEFYKKNYKKYHADLLIYIDASFPTLKERILNDNYRDKDETNWWYHDRFYLYDKILKKLPNIHIINTDKMTPKELLNEIKELVKFEED